jgi:hypothetical protein
MSVNNYNDLLTHFGHDIECVVYGDNDNVAIECITCGEVLMDYDRPPTPAPAAAGDDQ